MSHPTLPPARQRGFVLIIVLLTLVVLTLLAGSAALTTQTAIDRVQEELDIFEGELDMLSTRDTLLFMLSTQPRNAAGLSTERYVSPPQFFDEDSIDMFGSVITGNEIRLDRRAYIGIGKAAFALQDDRGLLNPNWGDPFMIHNMLKMLGVAPERYTQYLNTLEDYQDEDDLRLLNGAEQEQYQAAGLPPPSNQPLTTPLELRRILLWSDLLAPMSNDSLLQIMTVARTPQLNLNTAPVEVLRLLPGMDEESVRRMMLIRNEMPFMSIHSVQTNFPLNTLSEDSLTLFPNPSGNLILWDRHRGGRRLIHWTLSSLPNGLPPWRIDYEIELPRNEESGQSLDKTPTSELFPQENTSRH
ncbi:hypothetical protein CO613_04485 [Lysobacteraceae bacterium NML07-0707]|nr:hypothetical protein CO613_04485 [Xanthomonadaceae bacterium NML07-0707]